MRSLSVSRLPRASRAAARRAALAIAIAIALAPALPSPASSTQAQGPRAAGGRVEGTIRIGRALNVRRPRFRIYSDLGGSAAPSRAAAEPENQLLNVVVYLEGADRAGRAPSLPSPIMEQRAERFHPHVLPVVAGTTVGFPNADPLFHNVFSLSAARTFDLGRYPSGRTKSVTFSKPGVVQLFCHIHADMTAYVLVLDSPVFAVPDAEGRYALDDVAPGEYTLVTWHERAAPIRRRVRVTAGGLVTADVDIPVVDDDRR